MMLSGQRCSRDAGAPQTSRPTTCTTGRTLRHGFSCGRNVALRIRAQQQQQQQHERPQADQQAPPAAQQQQQQLAQPRSGPTGLNVGKHRPTSPAGWADMAAALREANVRVVAPQELPWLKEKGAVLLDIRPAKNYQEGHLPEAVHAAFYQPIQGWSARQVARRAGYALFGISHGTEVNPNFLEEVRQLVSDPASTHVVLYCNLGGSLEPTKNDRSGQQTRSMVAAYDLVQAGFRNVHVLKGGYLEWVANDREIEVFE